MMKKNSDLRICGKCRGKLYYDIEPEKIHKRNNLARRNNPERYRKYGQESYEKNKESIKSANSKRYHGEKHDKILEHQRKNHSENKITINKKRRIGYLQNPEPAKQRGKKYYEGNSDKVKDQHKKYLSNPENRDNTNRNYRKKRRELREKLMEILGGMICAECSFKNYHALQISHNFDDGGEERKKFSEMTILRKYIRSPDYAKERLTVLCANCHRIRTKPVLKIKNDGDMKTPKKTRERNARYLREKRLKQKKLLMQLLGGEKCQECGFSKIKALDFEHKFGGGSKEKLKFGGFSDKRIEQWLENIDDTKERIRVMCANCNQIKKALFHEYSK